MRLNNVNNTSFHGQNSLPYGYRQSVAPSPFKNFSMLAGPGEEIITPDEFHYVLELPWVKEPCLLTENAFKNTLILMYERNKSVGKLKITPLDDSSGLTLFKFLSRHSITVEDLIQRKNRTVEMALTN